MTPEQIIQLATIGTAVAAVFGVAFAVFSHRRQINASIYLDLSDRLHRLLQKVPSDYRSAQLSGKQTAEKNAEAIEGGHGIILAVDFLHIVNSAHTLYRSGYFSGKLWKQLKTQAEQGLRIPVVDECWPQLRVQFLQNPDFVAFVEECQLAHRDGR